MIHHISITDLSDTAGVGDTELLPSAPVPRGGYFWPSCDSQSGSH